ncbi:MAG: hypothetical protein Q9220_002663 [cf. Caloplaca sp. 1 TL-2023]
MKFATLSATIWLVLFTICPLAAVIDRPSADLTLPQDPQLVKRVSPKTYAAAYKGDRRMVICFCKTFTRSILAGYGKWENIADFTKNHFGKWLEDNVVSVSQATVYKANWRGFITLLESTINIMPSDQLRDAFGSQNTQSVDSYYVMDIHLPPTRAGEDFDTYWDQAFVLLNRYLSQGLGLDVRMADSDAQLMNWAYGNPVAEANYPKAKRDGGPYIANQFPNVQSDCILGVLDSDRQIYHDVPENVVLPWGPYSGGCGVDYCQKYWQKSCEEQFPAPFW